jgi:hypothetical protein
LLYCLRANAARSDSALARAATVTNDYFSNGSTPRSCRRARSTNRANSTSPEPYYQRSASVGPSAYKGTAFTDEAGPRLRCTAHAIGLVVTSRVIVDALPEQVWPLALPVLEGGDGRIGLQCRSRELAIVKVGVTQQRRLRARLNRSADLRRRRRLLVQRDQHPSTPSQTSRRIDLAMNRAVRRGSM